MKVFISWSGERSKQVAELLSRWLKCVLQASEPWISSEDIDRGALWFPEINSALNGTNGIVCLTADNLNSPWILFEAGALSVGNCNSRVCTFLVDVEPTDVKDPLAQYNHTQPTKESIRKLISTLNGRMDDRALQEPILSSVFNTYWPQFEEEFALIIKRTEGTTKKIEKPKSDDVLAEILSNVRMLDKKMRSLERDRDIRYEKNYIDGSKISEMRMNESKFNKDMVERRVQNEIENMIIDGITANEMVERIAAKYSMPRSLIDRIVSNCVEDFLSENGTKFINSKQQVV